MLLQSGSDTPLTSPSMKTAPSTPQQSSESPPGPLVRSLTGHLASNAAAPDDQSDNAVLTTAIADEHAASSSLKEPSASRRTHSRRGSELIVRDYANGNESAPPSSRFQAVEIGSPFRLSAHLNTSLDSPVVGFEQSGPVSPNASAEACLVPPFRALTVLYGCSCSKGPLSISDSPPLPSDPVPSYEASIISPRSGPRYVSKSLNDVWQSAQDDHVKRQQQQGTDCCRQRKSGAPLWLKLGESADTSQWHCMKLQRLNTDDMNYRIGFMFHLGILFLAVFILNFAFVFATVAVVERIENYDDGNGESAQGLLSGIIGQADDRSSSATQAKAAVLSALLTSLPAVVGALYAMKMVRKNGADDIRPHPSCSRRGHDDRLNDIVVVV